MAIRYTHFLPVIAAALFLVACSATGITGPKTEERLSVPFVVFGDSGYIPGNERKSGLNAVAADLQSRCVLEGCRFAAMLGDNIYPDGADGLPDSAADAWRFQNMFIAPFGLLGRNDDDFRIYAALGNHDWRTSRAGVYMQIVFHEKTPPFFMNGPFYSVRPPAGQGAVEVFVVDTEMLLAEQMIPDLREIKPDGSVKYDEDLEQGGSQNARPQTPVEARQLEWLKQALRSSDTQWKLVIGHHPLWESNGGKHAQAERLRELLTPILCA